jgi:hypothetical protein
MNFQFLLQNKVVGPPNSNLFEEGQPANHFAIIKSGDFDLVKTKLTNVYMNPKSGIVSIQLPNGQRINSSSSIPKEEAHGNNEDQRTTYVGSALEERITSYLGSVVN